MAEMKLEDDIEYIVNSDKQIDILRILRDYSSPLPKHKLRSETDVSRSTVSRATDNLSDRNWIEKVGRKQYAITTVGESVLERYDAFRNAISGAQTKTKLINQLGKHVEPPSIDVFSEAETEVYPTTDPMSGWSRASAEVSRQIDAGLDVYQGMNPIISMKGNEIGRKLLDAANEAELIIDKDVLDTAKESYTDELDEGLTADNFEIYVSPKKVPITLAMYNEKRVELSVHDDQGHPIGGIRGTNGELACWAQDLYEQYREQSYSLSELAQKTS